MWERLRAKPAGPYVTPGLAPSQSRMLCARAGTQARRTDPVREKRSPRSQAGPRTLKGTGAGDGAMRESQRATEDRRRSLGEPEPEGRAERKTEGDDRTNHEPRRLPERRRRARTVLMLSLCPLLRRLRRVHGPIEGWELARAAAMRARSVPMLISGA